MSIRTLNDLFTAAVSKPRPWILKSKRNGVWVEVTVPEFEETVRHLSTALRNLGVKPGDRVAILSENRPEWTMTDFAVLAAGGVSVPVYPTLLAWQIEHILNDSGSVAVVCSTDEQLRKIHDIKHHCPGLSNVIICDPPDDLPVDVLTFRELVENGASAEATEGRGRFDELLGSAGPADLATIVYTSGTTGNPKGAMLTHGNIVSNVVGTLKRLPIDPGKTVLSILPLSHILERTADFAFLYAGSSIAYAESILKVRDNLGEVRPHIFAAVPRLFEKMQMAIIENVETQPENKQKIFRWALGVARERLPYMVENKPMPLGLKLRALAAHKLVFHKILGRLGGNVEFVLSGGAPLSAELAAFFIGAGLRIYEGYGLTETSPVITINSFDALRLGTVGKNLEDVQVRIADDGEILTRGPHVMKGYFNNPEATAQAINSEGWFSTGDIGHIDADGFLHITDRKKDIIINAYGKNVAPQPLENLLKTSPYIATPVLIGDRRKYLVALIVPNFEKMERDLKAKGIELASREELVVHPAAREIVQHELNRINASLDRQEKIRRFAMLPEDFTIEQGAVTPSMKVKRSVIDQKFKSLIDEMYIDEAQQD